MEKRIFALATFLLTSIAGALWAQSPSGSRVCASESGVQVCRDVVAPRAETPPALVVEPPPAGKLLFLLDIPANLFSRLAQSPEQNREYHAKQNWGYQPRPLVSSGISTYDHARAPGSAAWQYHPKTSFAYQTKQDWGYDPDVFSRLWISNIQHDTGIVEVPTQTPGILLVPVQEVR